MSVENSFNIAFFGSSSFVLPILNDIYEHQGQELGKVAKSQWKTILKHKKEFLDILPNSILSLEDSIFDQVALKRPIQASFVVTQPDKEVRGKVVANVVAQYARKHNYNLYTPIKINNELKTFENVASNLDIAIVASFGQILSSDVINVARFGFLNWHPSKLPLYRGATPMQTALLNGDRETALSWIEMNEYMDAGDIYLQLQSNLDKHITFDGLSKQMGEFGKKSWALAIALRVLEGLKAEGEDVDTGMFVAKRQDYSQSTKTTLITKDDRYFYPSKSTAQEVYNHFRAYTQYPGTWYKSTFFKQEVKLIQVKNVISKGEFAHQVSKSKGLGELGEWYVLAYPKDQKVFLKCKEGYLEVEKICLASGKTIDFAGYVFEYKE